MGKTPTADNRTVDAEGPERRGFLTRALAVLIGGLVGAVPLASGIWSFIDPLRRKGQGRGDFVRVTTLDAVPPDGIPRQFTVFADRRDAWNYFPSQPVGSIFLRRTSPDGPIQAFSATCPHAGCLVSFFADKQRFQCPCHDSAFEPDGQRINPQSCPSPRDLDALETELRPPENPSEVWVRYQEFQAGTPEKIAKT